MKLITVIAASAFGSTPLPRKRNGLDDAMLVSQMGNINEDSVELKTYEERMVGILDNCGFFEDRSVLLWWLNSTKGTTM